MMRRISLLLLLLVVVGGCQGEAPVKFGAVLPLTGTYEIYGQSIRKGVELAYEELNADTTFPFQLELAVVDSQSDPDLAKDLLAKFYEEDTLAVIGGVTTAEALQMVSVAEEEDRVLISPSASSPELTGISANFYRVFPSDTREGTKMGNFAARKLGVENVVVLAKEEPYAKGIQEVFKAEFERNGGEVLDLIEFPSGSADFSGLVDRVMTLEPQAVYLAAFARDVGALIREIRSRGFEGTIITTSAFAAPEVIEQVGEQAEGVFLTQAVFEIDSEEENIRRFVEAYRAKYGLAPDLYAAHGYDSVVVLAESLKVGGRLPSEFWRGIRSIREVPGVTGTIQFDEKGDVQKFPRVYVVEEGNLVDYEKEVERRRKELLERLRDLEKQQRRAVDEEAPPPE